MEALEYQKKLAEYEQKITYYKLRAEEEEHKKAEFVLSVLDATIKKKKDDEEKNKISSEIKKGTTVIS